MANTDNLKPFEKGESGNPSGRPKGHISRFLMEFGNTSELEFTITKKGPDGKISSATATLSTGDKQTINQAIAARLLQLALGGDMKAIREVLNRTEGRVPQPINLGGQADNPLRSVDYGKTWAIKDASGGIPIPDPDED